MYASALEPTPTPATITRAALIYNPASGQKPHRRAARIQQAIDVLKSANVVVETIATTSPESAAEQARQAVQNGCDTILACGGDGTAHEVMQGLIGLRDVALGVIPMGTANALAADLGIPSAAGKAAMALLDSVRVRVPVGRIFYCDGEGVERSRYFVVAAGVGVDAHFFSRLDSKLKRRFGYAAYMMEALRLWATHTFPMFRVSFVESATGVESSAELSQLLAVRIGNFGGMVQKLVPGAALHKSNLSVVAIQTRSRLRYLRFMIAVWFRRHAYGEVIRLLEATSVECRELDPAARTYVEADGELLGALPARIEVVPDALTLLMPAITARKVV